MYSRCFDNDPVVSSAELLKLLWQTGGFRFVISCLRPYRYAPSIPISLPAYLSPTLIANVRIPRQPRACVPVTSLPPSAVPPRRPLPSPLARSPALALAFLLYPPCPSCTLCAARAYRLSCSLGLPSLHRAGFVKRERSTTTGSSSALQPSCPTTADGDQWRWPQLEYKPAFSGHAPSRMQRLTLNLKGFRRWRTMQHGGGVWRQSVDDVFGVLPCE
ncbi:hypothetical protein B0H14DRAFT_3502950 [Mycena olivaceomarginata]|nr:hypothetical protein B0H14DRAFT_3502950 [Mycena olivaceomarginata]